MAAPSYVYDLLASETVARWGGDAPRGAPVTITYSFPASQSASTSYGGFTAFNDVEIGATRAALAYISSLTNITFLETTAAGAELQFGNADLTPYGSGVGGRATYSYSTGDGIQNATVVLSNTGPSNLTNSTFEPGLISSQDIGGKGWGVLLHEIGHALGLKHPFERNIANDPDSVLPANVDDIAHTVMSYTPYQPSNVAIVTGTSSSYSYRSSNLLPQTFSLYDIAALQYLYGADTTSAGGNVFAYAPDAPVYETLYDAGPNNTIDCSALSGPNMINLNQGTFSDLAIKQTLPFGLTIDDQYDGSSAVAVAYGCVITNAIGGAGADTILGNAIANRIDGRAGADLMKGGLANDVYVVDSARDRVFEIQNQGNDTIESTASYTLSANVEILRLKGSAAINGAGNDQVNVLEGNDAANVLDGRGGADRMFGGLGNDTYYTDGLETIIEKSATGGIDKVISTASYTLGANVENLTLAGGSAIDGTGNALSNVIVGNGAANKITGFGGRDILTGGLGGDTFVYRALADSTVAPTTRDTISDFTRSQGDKIDLRLIDANTTVGNDQAFSYIGSSAFQKVAGELQAVALRGDTVLSGDVNGDGRADFSIYLTGAIAFNAATDIFA